MIEGLTKQEIKNILSLSAWITSIKDEDRHITEDSLRKAKYELYRTHNTNT